MIQNKYIFIFAITIFILLSITGPGIFLNDEWIVGQQLNQLDQGHQVTYNEGKYGYYINGTPNNYIKSRMNILTYPMAIPIISLPLELLFTLILSDLYGRFVILLLWITIGFYCWHSIKDGILSDVTLILFGIIATMNLVIFSSFTISGLYTPHEIIPIVLMNIFIMGIFSVTAFKLSELLFDDKNKQIVGWIASLSCTSLLFWAGTLKDHVLLSTIIILLCYCQVYYIQNNKHIYLIYTYLLAGISLWIRPEVGIFVIISLIIFNFVYMRRGIIFTLNELVWIFIATLPMFVNNILVTGSALKNPFLMASEFNPSGTFVEEVTNTTFVKISYMVSIFNIEDIIRTFVSPLSGSLGIIVPLCLFIFALITMIKYRQKLSTEIKFILLIGFGSIVYYLVYASSTMHRDGGIVPDIRYFTPAYALFTLFALSIIPYKLNYKKIIRNIFWYLPVMVILSLLTISIDMSIGSTYQTFAILPELLSLLTLFLMVIIFINDKTTNPEPILEMLIPIAIIIPLVWQLIIIFVYHSSKLISYPMFIPITEYLYKFMFGG